MGAPGVAAIALATLAACSSPAEAPSGVGLCWRMVVTAGQEPTFQVIARDVPNLESCAAQIEGVRILEGGSATGAYNGQFIFATEAQITSARTMGGTRVRIFEEKHRREIQAGLRALADQRKSEGQRAD